MKSAEVQKNGKKYFLLKLIRARRFFLQLSAFAYLNRRFIRQAAKIIDSHHTDSWCVDIGAGTTPYKRVIHSSFGISHYVSVDIAPSDKTCVVGNGCQLPFRFNSLDLVVAFQVLQHVPRSERMLDEIFRVLRSDGYVLLTVPFLYAECDVHDFRRWTVEGITEFLQVHGLQPLLVERLGGPCFASVCMLDWALHHMIPGQRRYWRAERNWKEIIRIGLLTVLTSPIFFIAWIALIVDHFLRAKSAYVCSAVLAKRGART